MHGDIAASANGGAIGAGLGEVFVYSGRTGAILHHWTGSYHTWGKGGLGLSLCGIGDLDRDGHADVAASYGMWVDKNSNAIPRITIFSGASGNVLRDVDVDPAVSNPFTLLPTIANAGDTDGDGLCELLVGCRNDGFAGEGTAYLFSGSSGSMLRKWGLYRPGQWGVRIENLVLNVPARIDGGTSEFGEFLEFETLTLCPIDTRCIERRLLRADEIAWLDAYHDEVRKRLSPLVSGDALEWLIERTQPL